MQRQKEISIEGEKLVSELRDALEAHCREERSVAMYNDERLDKLMPLADLIQPLEEIVAERKANSIMAAKFVKLIGVIGATAAAFYGVWQLLKEFMFK